MGRKEKTLPDGRTESLTIGELLRRLRNEQALPLTGLADLIGFSAGHLSNVETGRIQPSQFLLKSYEEFLGLRPSEISDFLLLLYTETIPHDFAFANVSPIDLKNALEIALSVDCFPSALQCIAIFIKDEGCSLSEYLEFYHPQVVDSLRAHTRRHGIHKLSLATVKIGAVLKTSRRSR